MVKEYALLRKPLFLLGMLAIVVSALSFLYLSRQNLSPSFSGERAVTAAVIRLDGAKEIFLLEDMGKANALLSYFHPDKPGKNRALIGMGEFTIRFTYADGTSRSYLTSLSGLWESGGRYGHLDPRLLTVITNLFPEYKPSNAPLPNRCGNHKPLPFPE